MKKLFVVLVVILVAYSAAIAEETRHLYSAGGVTQITTQVEYNEAVANPIPGMTYQVADHLYDVSNLSNESGTN